MFETFFAKLAGKFLHHKLDLTEGTLPTKSWWKSETIWSDVLTVVMAIVGLVDTYFTHGKIVSSPIYGTILTLLGAMGIHGRVTAQTKIG